VYASFIHIVCPTFVCDQGKTNNWIPSVAFAATALLTGILALILPETLNRPLPETIEDIEAWSRENTSTKNDNTTAPVTDETVIELGISKH